MDPRQRLTLELTWELLEDAYLVPDTLRGERVAVYVGAMTDDYAMLTLGDTAESLDHHSFAGVSRAMISNRVSYAFGLQGPSLTIDSGQSSSLVAVHLACEALRTGEIPLAIAGGVHLNLAGETALLEREFGAVSETGHTYAFDGRADGYVRSEGAGLVLLKSLRAALDDGDRIRAVIRASAVGNAGDAAAAQTVPSVSAEAYVIRRALRAAGLDADAIHYLEAHGTGTAIGDPVEATALGEVFAGRRAAPLALGSVKTNIGHAGGAAGIAGLLKAVLAIENGAIPASLNYRAPPPGVDLVGLGLRVATALTPWPAGKRRAGVSSFGMGGTNAHVIVEQRPTQPPEVPAAQHDREPTAWVVSAKSEQALVNQAERLLARVSDDAGLPAGDVAWTLATTRSVFNHRAVLVGDREALRTGLAGLANGATNSTVPVGHARSPMETVFVFPGQGAQWLGMGAQLNREFPDFAAAFDEVARALDEHLRIPLRDVVWGGDPALLRSTEFAQPALFAVEVALAGLLRRWGVQPDVVMGHSVGELTAAHVAGVLSLADAARVVAARGRLMAGLPTGGAMVAVGAGVDEVASLLGDGVAIAAINGPEAVVVSGPEAGVDAIARTASQRGKRVHRLAVSHAFHSPLMEPMVEDFAAAVAGIEPAQPRMPLISNVSGGVAEPGYGSAAYWVEHVRRPVRFGEGVRAAESLGADVFVEAGPGGGLAGAVEQSLTTQRPVAVSTLAEDRPEAQSLLVAAGRLFTIGAPVEWRTVLRRGRHVPLPTYGFARQTFWLGAQRHAPTPTPRPAELAAELRKLAPDERHRRLVGLVCTHAATVLGHSDAHAIDPERAFQDLGFDSLTGVELRNRLKADTGLPLSRTLVFDYPNPVAMAHHLGHRLLHGEPADRSDDDEIWSMLRNIPISELRRTGLLDKLLLLAGDPEYALADKAVTDDTIDALSPEALIAMALDRDVGEDAQ